MIPKILSLLKSEKSIFKKFCLSNNLSLDYKLNKNEFNILKAIFWNREYSDYFPFYKKVNIIDIGAHYGYFSIFAKNNTAKDSKIISIEPNKNNFNCLKENIKTSNIEDVKCLNIAIGGNSGLHKLYQGQSVNHSIVEKYSLLNQKSEFETIEVKTLEEIMLENEIKEVDFLKMDCEGSEFSILENTPKYIYDRIKTISMEFHDLKDNNYTGEYLVELLTKNDFKIVKYVYEKTSLNLNYGKIIGTKIFNN